MHFDTEFNRLSGFDGAQLSAEEAIVQPEWRTHKTFTIREYGYLKGTGMNKLPPFRACLVEDDPKPGSRWWHWYPASVTKRAKKYDEEVRLLYDIPADEPIPESLKALPTPPPPPTAEEIEHFNSLPRISYVDPNRTEPELTWRYRLRYSNVGMYFRYSVLEPLADMCVVCAASLVIGLICLVISPYYLLHAPYRMFSSFIRKKRHAVGSA